MDTNWGDAFFKKIKYGELSKFNRSDLDVIQHGVNEEEIERALRDEYLKINKFPKWAENSKTTDQQIQKKEVGIIHKSIIKPRKTAKVIQSLYVANYDCHITKASSVLAFHPSKNILFASGRHRHMQLFEINSSKSKMIKTKKFKDFPVTHAKFIKNGAEIMLSSFKDYFYFYNLESDQGYYSDKIRDRSEKYWKNFSVSPQGDKIALVGVGCQIPIISELGRQMIGCLTQGSSVVDAQFSKKSEHILYSIGSQGDMLAWDCRVCRCFRKVSFPQLFDTLVMSVSNQDIISLGSKMGHVSLFDFSDSLNLDNKCSLIKEFDNLKLPIEYNNFNILGNLLCFGTNSQRKGLRMVDLDDLSVMKTWPFMVNDLGINRIYGMDFSYDSKYLALGNNDGKIIINKTLSGKVF